MPSYSLEHDEPSIGSATMTADETIVMDLRAVGDGMIADARLTYSKDHPRYNYVRAHLGELTPGGRVHVRPFPPENVA